MNWLLEWERKSSSETSAFLIVSSIMFIGGICDMEFARQPENLYAGWNYCWS